MPPEDENKTYQQILAGIQSLQRDREDESEPEDLMRGRTFIPRMSSAAKKLLVEAIKKRREANAPKRAEREAERAQRKEERQDRREFNKEAREQMREANQDLRELREKEKAEKREERLEDRKIKRYKRYKRRNDRADESLAREAEEASLQRQALEEEFDNLKFLANGGRVGDDTDPPYAPPKSSYSESSEYIRLTPEQLNRKTYEERHRALNESEPRQTTEDLRQALFGVMPPREADLADTANRDKSTEILRSWADGELNLSYDQLKELKELALSEYKSLDNRIKFERMWDESVYQKWKDRQAVDIPIEEVRRITQRLFGNQ